MFSLKIENHKGEIIELTHNPAYTITEITGLNPPAANINTVEAALLDGAIFNSSRVGIRNIVINFAIENSAEANRIALYRYVKTKKPCTVYFQNGRRNVYINGYFETLDINLFEQKQMAQISIICPLPFFIDMEQQNMEFSHTLALFQFPFSIDENGEEFSETLTGDELYFNAVNSGDIETGVIITIAANGGSLTYPSVTNTTTGETFKVNYILRESDELIINTNRGQKSVTLIRGDTTTNLINYIDSSSTWLQLETGANDLMCNAVFGSENLSCSIAYNLKYEGV